MDNNTGLQSCAKPVSTMPKFDAPSGLEERGAAGENNMPLSYFQLARDDRTQPT
jgi:hypothetical protein